MTKSSAPLGLLQSSLDAAYAKSRATSAVMLDLTRAAGHRIPHVRQLSHDVNNWVKALVVSLPDLLIRITNRWAFGFLHPFREWWVPAVQWTDILNAFQKWPVGTEKNWFRAYSHRHLVRFAPIQGGIIRPLGSALLTGQHSTADQCCTQMQRTGNLFLYWSEILPEGGLRVITAVPDDH